MWIGTASFFCVVPTRRLPTALLHKTNKKRKKMMKKLFSRMLLLGAVASMVVSFASCSKDDDKDENLKEQIVGTWDATAVKFDGGEWTSVSVGSSVGVTITFRANGTYAGSGALGNGEGTYTLDGRTIKTYVDGQLYGTYTIRELNGSTAELRLTMGSESVDIRAKKR